MSDNANQLIDAFLDEMKEQVETLGMDAVEDWDDLRLYTSQQAQLVAAAMNEGGDPRLALEAARNNVALKAGLAALENAVGAERQFYGFLQGGILLIAKLISLGTVA